MIWHFGKAASAACLLASLVTPTCAEDNYVTFKIGTNPVIEKGDAFGYARYYVSYAAHAVESYRELKELDNKNSFGNFKKQAEWEKTSDQELIKLRINAALKLHKAGWTFVGGYSGPMLCSIDKAACALRPIPARGLSYQFWKRSDCSRIAIVFRGTDPTSFSDWYSNFRWVTRVLPFADEYDQVRQNIDRIVLEAETMSNCRGANAKIFAIGHSLGGGLAQLAAYSHGRIKRVYAFDSSPVTAIYDLDQATVAQNAKDLIIDRVYEKGEILSLPRRLTEIFFKPSECNPQVRTAEFNTITGVAFANNPIGQHSIDRLWAGLSGFANKATARLKIPGLTNRNPTGCDIKVAKGGKSVVAGRKQSKMKYSRAMPRQTSSLEAGVMADKAMH